MTIRGITFSFWQDTSFGICALVILATTFLTPIGGVIAYFVLIANMAKRKKIRESGTPPVVKVTPPTEEQIRISKLGLIAYMKEREQNKKGEV